MGETAPTVTREILDLAVHAGTMVTLTRESLANRTCFLIVVDTPTYTMTLVEYRLITAQRVFRRQVKGYCR